MRNHPAHASPRRDLRNRRAPVRPIHTPPHPLRWSESGRTPLISGGQSRTSVEVEGAARAWAGALLAAAGVVVLIVVLGLVGGALR